MFTLDLYRSAFRPDATDAHCVKVGKVYGTIAGCVSIVIAPFVMNAKGMIRGQGTSGSGAFQALTAFSLAGSASRM